ncbi:GNAT family N-acetyltransferase [bacterium]|nr:GNAT family N-acetyltransferase [bacterium]
MNLKVLSHREFSNVRGLEQLWRQSVTPASGYLYVNYNFDWISKWHQFVYPNGTAFNCEQFILTAENCGQLVGAFPLLIGTLKRKGWLPYRCLYFLGHEMVDHADFIISPLASELLRTQIIKAFWQYLKAHRSKWDEARLHLIPEDSPNLIALLRNLREDGACTHTLSPTENFYINTKNLSWNEFIAGKGRDITSDVKRRLNKLSRLGVYSFECNQESDMDSLFHHMKEIHTARQQELDRSSLYLHAGKAAFVREIMMICADRGELDYSILRLNNKIIAYMVGFRVAGVRYSWNVGFDPQYGDVSPGKLIMYLWIKEAFENSDVSEFNFMRGGAGFKRAWTNSARFTQKLQFFSTNYYSRCLNTVKNLNA